MKFTDTHSHIYSAEFDGDLDAIMTRALAENVSVIFLPAIDSEYHEKMLKVADAYPENCFPMMGLHPTSVKNDFRNELQIVERYFSDGSRKFYAIGEIGIDLYWDKTHAAEQEEAFGIQLDMAIAFDLPVIIHTRNSMDLVLDILEMRNDSRLNGIFHCFSGNIRQAERVMKLGFFMGIGGVVTYKNSGLQQVVEHVSLENLVLETDAPWLTPAPYRGKRNEPSYISLIASKIAEIKGVTVEKVAEVTNRNAAELFFKDPSAGYNLI
jgi:TatD DNase family protein